MEKITLRKSFFISGKMLLNVSPILFATLLLVSAMSTLIPNEVYFSLFSKNTFFDSFIGASIGSISAGNPLISYIFGGELLKKGVSLLAVTAFLVSWVTVGIIQYPAEAMILGKKFAFLRNILAFIFSIIVAFLTIFILGVLIK
jgi:uncharacterized membrane protein YraQ (UPF0718 family)